MKKNNISYKVGLIIGWSIVIAIPTIVILSLAAIIKFLAGLVF